MRLRLYAMIASPVAFQSFLPCTLVLPKKNQPCISRRPLITLQASPSQKGPQPPWRREDDLLSRLNAIPEQLASPSDSSGRSQNKLRKSSEPEGQLIGIVKYLRSDLSFGVDRYLSNPFNLITSAALAILFGFFSATSAATIIGSVADWDPLAAAVLLIWTESFTKFYYTAHRPSRLLQLINAFKIGLIYGMTIDALKLSN
ncbi:hypothetical protein BWQ96_03605 [Gracilariopsis chorda]|uniref:Uncharacterized protein ycf20 n=1 Tax=Gracilariopsis chorda TaxID=448386 RepID=A0A2V3IWT9_9FLOR|nr:hypothetical protein BWQ96_03605 [Gracilariopsis chorda]|eukprot:PXF46616.1 hypothetical protein BWQ96_03605 [Gracilariopsis chorda]